MRTRLWISLVAGWGLVAPLGGSPDSQRRREGPVDPNVIEWPSRDNPRSLQQAIDATPEGGKLRILEGEYEVREPLFVRKRITIEGAGCETLRSGKSLDSREVDPSSDPLPKLVPESRSRRVTRLAGPPPSRVVEARASVAMFNYINVGGVLKGVAISGWDAGVRGTFADDGAQQTKGGLVTDTVCVNQTGRGVVWPATSALTLQNVTVTDVLWSGVSVFHPSPLPITPIDPPKFVAFNLVVIATGYACIVVKDAFVVLNDTWCSDNLGGGILGVNATLWVINGTVLNTSGPGMAFSNGSAVISDSTVNGATGFGILFSNPASGLVEESWIVNTKVFTTSLFGDGVTVAGGQPGSVHVADATLVNNVRAGVSSFGAIVSLIDTKITCSGFDLEAEAFLGQDFDVQDLEGNRCGCPVANRDCTLDTIGLSPPAPPAPIE